jgi:ATP-dependent DNA ligase
VTAVAATVANGERCVAKTASLDGARTAPGLSPTLAVPVVDAITFGGVFGGVPAPMLARLQRALPRGQEWRYEPKLDGFRGLLWRPAIASVHLLSRSLKDLGPVFPELIAAGQKLPVGTLLDGEIVIACNAPESPKKTRSPATPTPERASDFSSRTVQAILRSWCRGPEL